MSSLRAAFFRLMLVVCLLTSWIPVREVSASVSTQQRTPEQKAADLLNRMSPEERVGQLFLITFNGTSVDANTKIYELLSKYHIGGVALKAANENFPSSDSLLQNTQQLITTLQNTVWDVNPTAGSGQSTYAPLFIGISQEGNLYPYDQIINGMTPLPDAMSIGATWSTDMAESVGSVMGKELSTLGFNLYLGPSLDVLDVRLTEGDDLSTRSFGGDPYWVGELGKSYIQGLHSGSQNHMAVIAKHFPGRGSSDRSPDLEVATVRRSLEQLTQVELAPFFAVTGNAFTPETTTDGLLVSHIRYQGFQGNIRVTTRPVSFDQAALEQLMGLPQFSEWRSKGGIVVTEDLGSQAVRKFYDPNGVSFDARQVARSAFLAGNDLLYMDNFVASGDADKYATLARTLDFFIQKYQEDQAFAKRVDSSALRLLTLKYRLYGNFTLEDVLPSQTRLSEVGNSSQVSFEVAQRGATLINPSPNDLSSILPHAPELGDRLVFFTDTVMNKPCAQCKETPGIAVDAMQRAVIKLYGPQSGAQVLQYRLSSYSFGDLLNYLNGAEQEQQSTRDDDIRDANWIVFAMTDVSKDRPASQALQRFLSERQQLIRDKKIIVFAFDAPYYLDATDISKITAYYALYSKTPSFVEAAVRILFQELSPSGALPISMPAVGYDLATVTSPDPAQVIPLMVDTDSLSGPQLEATETPAIQLGLAPTLTPTGVPRFKSGDVIPLITGKILDHNRNIVPDGTIVRFVVSRGNEADGTQQIEAQTQQGVARGVYRIQSAGFLEIKVVSEPAIISQLLRLDISENEAAAVTAIAPTLAPTPGLAPTATTMPTEMPEGKNAEEDRLQAPAFGDWLFSMILTAIISMGMYDMGRRRVSLRWGVRWGLMTAIGGLIGYFIILFADRGRGWGDDPFQFFGFIFTGMLIGWAISWIWQKIE